MSCPFNMIVARCKNNGIGYKGQLPWSLRKELQYFERMTKRVNDLSKKNAVVMGRKTWDSLPKKMKPLPGRLNFVLSTQLSKLDGAILCANFDELIKEISRSEISDQIETVWIIGGRRIYEEAFRRDIWHRLYLTDILKEFECDTFLNLDIDDKFKEVSDDSVPSGIQEENGVQYVFHVYEKAT